MQASRYSWPKVLWVDDIVPEPDHDSGGCCCVWDYKEQCQGRGAELHWGSINL